VSSLLFRNKSNAVFSISDGSDEAVVLATGRRNDFALDVSVGAVHVEKHRLRNVGRNRRIGNVGETDALRFVGRWLDVNLKNK
jgi:hypothetical protein